eukprot:CAMPEP_0201699558 /NCGR_PEP_ID=MMETSP0578-20130828/24485_1 /ASSEMBLY_ACC=CAM_ASM_000663 /TAXON_ID=267565 /ORGANISM="Skeletonema grethea, Strain CCMP 1804" /LENGTH=52 /DNA_ID=CAMNT_0048186351 /DNA_START=81 /DNA_END=236 /DNA_ORIENTATION=+
MNDRLAELQDDIPSWAQEENTSAFANEADNGAVDIEMGNPKKKKKKQKKNDE